jgi:16S rRNA (cytidine1402-2'-O)-methyltransferase
LYVVATPIGNLDDMTMRAIEVLKSVNLIACEDTRHSRRLLDHFGIDRPLVSYHEHNETSRAPELVGRIEDGDNVALISDAGTPLISDPGYRIVTLAAERGLRVVPVPGASALLATVAVSGLPTDSFFFGGFLPAKSSQRRRRLEEVRRLDACLVFYEAPHRAAESLGDMRDILGDRPAVVTRELTKLHEEVLRGTLGGLAAEIASRETIRGEITIMAGKPVAAEAEGPPLTDAVQQLIDSGMSQMEAIKSVARQRGLPKRDVYAEFERATRSSR